MAEKDIQPGDEVTWKYGRGHPTGTVEEVKTDAGGKLAIETAGKTVTKNSDPENPAIHVAREGNDVVKRASELQKIGERENHGAGEKEGDSEKVGGDIATSKEAVVGEKRERDGEGAIPATEATGDETGGDEKVEKELEEAKKGGSKMAKKPKLDSNGDTGTGAAEKEKPKNAIGKRTRGRGRGKGTTATRTSTRRRKTKTENEDNVGDSPQAQVEQ